MSVSSKSARHEANKGRLTVFAAGEAGLGGRRLSRFPGFSRRSRFSGGCGALSSWVRAVPGEMAIPTAGCHVRNKQTLDFRTS
jgi:hypothetical protein